MMFVLCKNLIKQLGQRGSINRFTSLLVPPVALGEEN